MRTNMHNEGNTEKQGVYKHRQGKKKYTDIESFWDMTFRTVLINPLRTKRVCFI
jgi:hypothetical protein